MKDTNQQVYNGQHIPVSFKEICNPAHTALLVYDAQAGIFNQIKDGEKVLTQMLKAIDGARKAGIRIFYSRHLSLPKELLGVSQLRMAMEWEKVKDVSQVKPFLTKDSPSFQLTPQISPLANEVVFDKITMSALEGTYLNIAWRDCGIKTFVIIGAAIEIGIEPTIRHGSDLGYIPVMLTDACGYGNKEPAERSINSIAYAGYCVQTTVDEFVNALGVK